jgi:hypothetical protein
MFFRDMAKTLDSLGTSGVQEYSLWAVLDRSNRNIQDFDGNVQKILSGRFAHFRQFHQKKEGTETFFAFFP